MLSIAFSIGPTFGPSGICTSTMAVSLSVISALLVALTWKVPALFGGVYLPVALILPAFDSTTLQSTSLLVALLTLTKNCLDGPPTVALALDGLTVTDTRGMVMVAESLLVESSRLVALTTAVAGVLRFTVSVPERPRDSGIGLLAPRGVPDHARALNFFALCQAR